MDRSQQGVAPRTCLSKLPLKPRPMGPPPGAKSGPPRAVPRPGQGLMGPPPRPIPGAKVRQNSSSSQGSAVSQPRRPSIQPSKQSSPTLAEQAQSRQRSMSVAASPTKAPRQTEQQRAVSAAEAHSRSASMGTASSAEKSSSASGATTPLGVPARKPVPGQAL